MTQFIQIIVLLLAPYLLVGQLSPGALSEAHKDLEGIANCTQCHSLGNKIPDSKCLDCHQEINELILSNRGLHAAKSTMEKTCIDCHSEHHGRKFDMVRFDQEAFDHSITRYSLEGQHAVIDCKECHTPENIADPEISKREETFLGLDQECLSCHQDFHQGTLSSTCIDCHDFDAFRPARYFDHDQAKFKLRGAHIEVDCKECHQEKLLNKQSFQQFTGLDFADCVDCHTNPHNSTWKSTCASCHTETSFSSFNGRNSFNHNRTGFELKGAHKEVGCFECHVRTNASSIFSDHTNVLVEDCNACHKDPHEGKFGNKCAECHNETSFLLLNDPSSFDHGLTDFSLEGRHLEVDCKECHLEKYTDPIAFAHCFDCHEDYHEGEFMDKGIQRDCDECHTLEESFSYTTFGFEEHASSSFNLDGAHMATPCFECHVREEHWSFRNIGTSCIDCHDDIHDGHISYTYYPEKNCSTCHTTEFWSDVQFDHDLTAYTLLGQHLEIRCSDCHFSLSKVSGSEVQQKFKDLSSDCIACHKNPHGDQFEKDGQTDCASCHHSYSWSPDNFNHDSTDFPLEGRHKELECVNCHKNVIIFERKETINFKIERFDCIDCHQ